MLLGNASLAMQPFPGSQFTSYFISPPYMFFFYYFTLNLKFSVACILFDLLLNSKTYHSSASFHYSTSFYFLNHSSLRHQLYSWDMTFILTWSELTPSGLTCSRSTGWDRPCSNTTCTAAGYLEAKTGFPPSSEPHSHGEKVIRDKWMETIHTLAGISPVSPFLPFLRAARAFLFVMIPGKTFIIWGFHTEERVFRGLHVHHQFIH